MATTQLRHFCTHALDDIIDFVNTSPTRGAYDLYTREAVQWIRSAQKFSYSWAEAQTVPEDLTREWLTQDHPRLPFEFTAIELVDNYRDGINEMETVFICANLNVIDKVVFKLIQDDLDVRDDTDGFLVWPIQKPLPGMISYTGKLRWYPSPVLAVILPREEMDEWESNAHEDQKYRIGGTAGDPFLMVQHLVDWQMTQNSVMAHLQGEGHDLSKIQPDWMDKNILAMMESYGKALMSDCKVVASMCTLLECSNVVYATHPAPRKLNLKRRKRQREPFFEYKTLVIDPHKDRVITQGLVPHNLRRSPKLHLRRGHIRKLRSGSKTWVSQAMIGSKRRGMVLKDYEIREEGK